MNSLVSNGTSASQLGQSPPLLSFLEKTIIGVALGAIALIVARGCERANPNLAILLKCAAVGVGLIWLFDQCFSDNKNYYTIPNHLGHSNHNYTSIHSYHPPANPQSTYCVPVQTHPVYVALPTVPAQTQVIHPVAEHRPIVQQTIDLENKSPDKTVNQYKLLNLNNLKDLGMLKQIPVLDQNYRSNGDKECGFHAFKNALIGVALGLGMPDINQQDFNRPEIFTDIFDLVKNVKKGLSEDASIAELHQAFLALSEAKPDELSPLVRSLQTITYEKVISFINIGQDWQTDQPVISTDASTINYLSNLRELSYKPAPWTHAFVVGSKGHWITLIAQKDNKGSITWLGMDSWKNQSDGFKDCLDLLKLAINNSYNENWWQTQYDNALGNWLNHKSNWIDIDGNVMLSEHKESLLNEKSREDYVQRVINGFNFIKTAGWLKAHHKEEIIALDKFAKLFQKFEIRPETKKQLSSIIQELNNR